MIWKFRFLFLGLFFTFLYTFFYAQFHVDPHHDGVILKPALDVFYGKRLFVDSFTQYGAFTTIIHVAFMKIIGPSLFAIRFSAVIFYCGISVLLYLIWRRFLPSYLTFLAVLVWLTVAYFPNQGIMVPFLGWSSVYALFFQLLASWGVFKYLESDNKIYLFLVGSSIALTFWARQPVGIFLSGAVGIFFVLHGIITERLKKTFNEILNITIGGILISVPFAIWIIQLQAITQWWEQSIKMAFSFGKNLSREFSFSHVLSTLLPSAFAQKKNVLWNLLPLSTLILFFSRLAKYCVDKRLVELKTKLLLALSLISLASWLQYFPGADHSHAYWAATPMIGLLFVILPGTIDFIIRHSVQELGLKKFPIQLLGRVTSVIIITVVLLPFVSTSAKGLKYYLRSPFETIQSPPSLQGMRVTPGEAIVYRNVSNHLDTYFSKYPAEYILNMSPDAVYMLFDPHFKQFHRQTVYWDWASQSVFTDYLPQAQRLIEKDKPAILVRDSVIFGLEEDQEFFSDYCAIDLASKEVLRVQILMRPLVFRAPTKKIASISIEKNGLSVEPLIGSVQIISADQDIGGGISADLLGDQKQATTSSKQQITFPNPIKGEAPHSIVVSFISNFAGTCLLHVSTEI